MRRGLCLLAAGLINAVLFVPMMLGLRPGGDGVMPSERMTVVLLNAAARAEQPKAPKPAVPEPQNPSLLVGEHVEQALAGPPTETAESVQRQLAESKAREAAEQSHELQCDDIPVTGVDRSRVVAVLSLRISVDGRAISAEIDRSSGRANIDNLLLRCAKQWGPFPISIVDGRIVESWQTIEWPAPSVRAANLKTSVDE